VPLVSARSPTLGMLYRQPASPWTLRKVCVVLEWPPPRMVCAFLGLAGYYHRFIKNYGAIVAPLTALLRKDGFRWSSEAEAAFRALQQALTMVPVLQLLNCGHEFTVECDTLGSGLSAVLHQGGGPVAFFSRALALRHMKLAAYERELIGLVQVVRLAPFFVGALLPDYDGSLLPQIPTRSALVDDPTTLVG
jgi:hypothetical protein